MAFEIWMNGVGNAFSRKHFGTSFIVRKDDFLLAVDCPDSYRRALLENAFELDGEPVDVDRIDAAFITHLHGDHVNGLEMSLAYYRYQAGRQWQLYSSPEVAQQLWPNRLAVSLGRSYNGESYDTLAPEDFYELRVVEWGEPTQVGPFEITTRPTVHHVPTAALRITDGDATLGHSCDTAYDPALIEWLSDADLILHETSLGPGHTPLHKLLDLDAAVRDKIRVVHYPDMIDPDQVEGIAFARQGACYTVAGG